MADVFYEVLNMETSGELNRNRLNLTLNLSNLIQSPSITSIDTITPKEEYESGNKKQFNNKIYFSYLLY